jgi:hypothetical protein
MGHAFGNNKSNVLLMVAATTVSCWLTGCSALKSMSDTTTPPLPVVSPPPVNNWPNVNATPSMVARSADQEPEPQVARVARQTAVYTDQVSREIDRRKMEQQRASDIREQREVANDHTEQALKSSGFGIGENNEPTVEGKPQATPVAVNVDPKPAIERRPVVVDAPKLQPLAPEQLVSAPIDEEPAVVANQVVDVQQPTPDAKPEAREPKVRSTEVGNLANPTDVSLTQGRVDQGSDFTQALVSKAKQQPDDLAAQLDSQLARYLKDQPAPVASELEHVGPEDRELVSAVIDGLVNFRNQVRTNPDALSADRARPLIEMADRIRAASELRVSSVTLCSAVKGFGDYQPVEPRFVAGQPSVVVLYSEVDNFTSTQVDGGKWQTKLAYEVRIYTEGGMEVWSERSENVTDMARRKRQDFFVAKMIRLPANLTVGRYSLKVTVRDLQANRVAESALPIQYVARLDNLSPVQSSTPQGDNK